MTGWDVLGYSCLFLLLLCALELVGAESALEQCSKLNKQLRGTP